MNKRYLDRIMSTENAHICPYCGANDFNLDWVRANSFPDPDVWSHWKCALCSGRFRRVWNHPSIPVGIARIIPVEV